ncbi:hypothetical protein PRIPAC_77604, partial [Pristionchus pacificus]|uniref:Uncharacterized protein n=1 Tax=Pristionchus pacificus TaxID=54126 RepID=A0A2A6BHB7_PRIPA
MSNPEKFLLELSSLVRSIYIHDRSAAEHSLFGIHRAYWVRVILDMFSRKLDKLWIDNNPYSNVSVNHVTALCEQLPLMRKRIWLEAGCTPYLSVNHPKMQRTMKGGGAAGEWRSMQPEQLEGNKRLFSA